MKKFLNSTLLLVVLFSGLLFPYQAAEAYINIKPRTMPLCLGFNTPNNDNIAELSLNLCVPINNYQKFTELPETTTTYLASGHTGNTKALEGGGSGNGVPVLQQTFDYTKNSQQWAFQSVSGGWWIKNDATEKCLTAESSGANCDQTDCSPGQNNQVWTLSAALGLTKFTNVNTSKPLEVVASNPNNGATTAANSVCTPVGYNQVFQQILAPYSLYQILGSTKCLDAGSAGQKVYQYDCVNAARNHQWSKFQYPSEAGTIYFYYRAHNTGLCLTYETLNWGNVYTSACTPGNTLQHWITSTVS